MAANVNGLGSVPKRTTLGSLDADLLVMCETHAGQQNQSGALNDMKIVWGKAVSDYCGIALAYNSAAVWGVCQIPILENDPLYAFWKVGRLALFQVFIGSGKETLLIYGVYGLPGSRWSRPKRRQTEALILAAMTDAQARGLPAIIAGDYNLQISDSTVFARLESGGFLDASVACTDDSLLPTCLQGGETRIDHIFISGSLQELLLDYTVSV